MAQKNRHLRGDTRDFMAPVRGNVTIEQGDLVVINWTAGTVTRSASGRAGTADNYAYPIDQLAQATSGYFGTQFAGVAMLGSKSGTTDSIPIATDGVFRYPASPAAAGVSPGVIVSATTTGAEIMDKDAVQYKDTPSDIGGGTSTIAVGRCIKRDTTGTNIDFQLVSRLSGVSYADMIVQ